MNNGRANVIFIDKLECENVALLTYVTFGWILDPHLHSIEGFRIPDSVEIVSCFLFFVFCQFFRFEGRVGVMSWTLTQSSGSCFTLQRYAASIQQPGWTIRYSIGINCSLSSSSSERDQSFESA